MKKVSYLVAILLMATIALSSCSLGNIVSGKGAIQFNDFEGGFYGIVADDGECYDPINLDEEFKVDGLRVRFKVKVREDLVSFHMWGLVVEIIKIKKL